MSRRAKPLMILTALVVAFWFYVGSSLRRDSRHSVADDKERERRLSQWRADSTRFDSIVDGMPLAKLEESYRAVLTAEYPPAALERVRCFGDSLVAQYGLGPTQLAIARAKRVAFADTRALAEMRSRTPSFVQEIDVCAKPAVHAKIGNTNVDEVLPSRP